MAASLSRTPSGRQVSGIGETKDWDPTIRLPQEPVVVSQIRDDHPPRPLSQASAGSRGADGSGGGGREPDERLARMMLALDEHERRDPRSRQARQDATFFASLRLMLREAYAASGPARTQQIAQLEKWFETERPRPRESVYAEPLDPGAADNAASERPETIIAGVWGGVQHRGGDVQAAGRATTAAEDKREKERRRAAGAARLIQSSPYTPYDVRPDLAAYKRRDLYTSFARREGLDVAHVLPDSARIVPGSRPPAPPPKSPFAHYSLSADPAVAGVEEQMDAAWVERRKAEALAAAEDEQMGYVAERWAVSRARVDEEIGRRRESSMYAAQGGRRFHRTCAGPRGGAEGWKEEELAQGAAALHLRDASDDDGLPGGAGAVDSDSASDAARTPRQRTFITATSLRGDHPRVILSQRVGTVERPFDGGTGGVGLSAYAPGCVAERAMAGAARPATAQQLHRMGAGARRAFLLRMPEPPPGRRDASAHASGARTARPESAPSARRIMQLQECRRIKTAFDKYQMPCDTSVLERALVTPEDLPDEVCLAALPSMRSREMDPDATRLGERKGKKAKGKVKKKAKGKVANKKK